jgi:hypothetical protein
VSVGVCANFPTEGKQCVGWYISLELRCGFCEVLVAV